MTLRYFGGLTVAEVAVALGVSVVTVERDWRLRGPGSAANSAAAATECRDAGTRTLVLVGGA